MSFGGVNVQRQLEEKRLEGFIPFQFPCGRGQDEQEGLSSFLNLSILDY